MESGDVGMDGKRDSAESRSSDVLVYMNDHEATRQPQSFQFCPLGVQFCMPDPLSECDVLEFRVNVPGDDGASSEITCTGFVVNCCKDPDSDMYRIWVKFLDLPLQTCAHLQRISRENNFLCPYCENFR